jgi:hypothetical protein
MLVLPDWQGDKIAMQAGAKARNPESEPIELDAGEMGGTASSSSLPVSLTYMF